MVDTVMTLDDRELAYFAGIVDTQAAIRNRTYSDTLLPVVEISSSTNMPLVQLLARRTGTKVTEVRRPYSKAGCAEHCPEKHMHIVSTSGRWTVSGAKATILLVALRPFLQFQGYAADEAIEVGMKAPKKQATAGKMVQLGWPLPEGWE